MNTTALLLALAAASCAGSAFAVDGFTVKDQPKRDGSVVASPSAVAPRAARADRNAAKTAAPVVARDGGAVDPYNVPLLRNAPSLR